MLSRELIEAVKERIELEHTKEEIMAELEGAGYDHDMIEEVYQVAEDELQRPAPAHSIPNPGTGNAVPQASSLLIGYGDLLRSAKDLAIAKRNTFAQAFGLVFVAYASFATVTAVLAFDLLGTLLDYVDDQTNPMAAEAVREAIGATPPQVLLLLGVLTIALFLFTTNIRLALLRNLFVREQNESFRGSFAWGWRYLIAFIVITFFFSMATQFGYLLLIIPGIALSLYLSFGSYALIDENERGLRALTRSTELVYGRWWGVFGRYLVVALILLGAVLAFGLVMGILTFILGIAMGGAAHSFNLIIIPTLLTVGATVFIVLATWYVLCFRVVLYESLKASVSPQPLAEGTPRKLRILFIVFIIGGVCLTIFNVLQEEEPNPRSEFTTSVEILELRQELQAAQTQAELFVLQNELQRYSGLCNEMLSMVSEEFGPRCLDGADGYALYAQAGGEMWCFDNTGFLKEIQVRPTGTSCLNAPPGQPTAVPEPTPLQSGEAPSASRLAMEFLAEGDVANALSFTRMEVVNLATELGTVTVSEYNQVVSTRTLTVAGVADDRPALNALRTATEAQPAVASVALPLDDPAVATDIPFTMEIMLVAPGE